MKNCLYIILVLAAVLQGSCAKDTGNYLYSDAEQLSVTGLQENYAVLTSVDRLVIDPEVSSSVPGAEFEYTWSVYEKINNAFTPVKAEQIAVTKKLDYPVRLNAKNWTLVFSVKNKKTGYTKQFQAALNVMTAFSRGWYVLKDDGLSTDLDLFGGAASYLPDVGNKREALMQHVNGKALKGAGQLLGFSSNYKSLVSGALANTRVLYLTSSNDIAIVDVNTMKLIRGFDQLFYETPAVAAPSMVTNSLSQSYIVNNGLVHSIFSNATNTGIYGAPMMIDNQNSTYRASKYFLTNRLNNSWFFDELSTGFFCPAMSNYKQTPASQMNYRNTGKDLLFMGNKDANTAYGYALFRDKADPSVRILSKISLTDTSLVITNDILTAASKLHQAEKFALLQGDEDLLYFSTGNEIFSRSLIGKTEAPVMTLPADEEISFMRHRSYAATGAEAPFAFNLFMVGTQKAGKYKVRMYRKLAGKLEENPVFILEGDGTARDVFFMSPMVSVTTFPNTW